MKPALFRATRDDDDGGESRRGIEYNGRREEDIKIGRKRFFAVFAENPISVFGRFGVGGGRKKATVK